MEEPDGKQLSQIAQRALECAHEAAKITQDIILAIHVADPTLEEVRKQLSCFAGHCSVLSLQLVSSGDLQGLVAKPVSDKYWKCIHDVLDLWHKNLAETVERLRKNQKLRSGPTSWILSSNVLTQYDPRIWTVEAAAKSYMQDVQLVTALLNLQLTLRDRTTSDGGHYLDFLVKDLEVKARTVHDRVSRLRQELKLPPTWSRIQSFIAELAMETAMEINLRVEGSDKASTIVGEPLIVI